MKSLQKFKAQIPTSLCVGAVATCVLAACGGAQNSANSPSSAAVATPSPVDTSATPSDLLPSDLASVGSDLDPSKKPSENFNLRPWKLTLPEPNPKKPGKVLEIEERDLSSGFVHKLWFQTHAKSGGLVFRAPNHAATTKNSSNTRSELRNMIRAGETRVRTHSPRNNFAIPAHPDADSFDAMGGKLAATLQVDVVSLSGNHKKFAAHSVVVGQIHGSGKMEPVKIYYRKLPDHDKGSLFWNYELSPSNPDDRKDIPHNVWGDYRLTAADPSPEDGIALSERFSYVIDVTGNMLTVSFKKANGETVAHQRDLSRPYAGYDVDRGYAEDWMYFKAGAYNQCNLGNKGTWGTACTNKGLRSGDFTQVTFFQIDVSH